MIFMVSLPHAGEQAWLARAVVANLPKAVAGDGSV